MCVLSLTYKSYTSVVSVIKPSLSFAQTFPNIVYTGLCIKSNAIM